MDMRDEQFLKRINETFRIEAEEHLVALSAGLIDLKKKQSQDKYSAIIETMFREIHSLKGAARSVEQKSIESICQPLESLLSSLKRKEFSLPMLPFDIFNKALDTLAKHVKLPGSQTTDADRRSHKELLKVLNEYATGNIDSEDENKTKQTIKLLNLKSLSILPAEPADESELLPGPAPKTTETVRIRVEKLDPVLLQAEEMIQIKKAIGQRIFELQEINAGMAGSRMESRLADFTRSMERDKYNLDSLVDAHLESMRSILMLPVSTITESFAGMVREISAEYKKEIDFIIKGADLEIDKRILEELKDPLIHLIRNSIDHGIDKPQERILKNKPAKGTIALAFQASDSGIFNITVSDDGNGIDSKHVLDAAIKSGTISEEESKKLNPEEIESLIYQSGVSTSSFITDLSGRGLGLSIVHEKVEKLNGSISVDSAVNRGTAFNILIPMALAAFRGIMVRISEFMFIIPALNVEKVINVSPADVRTIENHDTILIADQVMSIADLGEVLGLPEHQHSGSQKLPAGHDSSDQITLVVLNSGVTHIAFRVDEVYDEQQVLVKSPGKLLKRIRNISGATISGSGRVVPVLHVNDLLKSALTSEKKIRTNVFTEKNDDRNKNILVADDSITSRTLIKNILEAAGYKVTTAIDGKDAFAKAHANDFDLIISDVDMPLMNGFELIVKIRHDKKLSEIPAILITALGSVEDRERGIDVGADAYIIKSNFDQDNLLEIIKKLI